MNESNIGGVSVRGIIAIIVMAATCGACIYHIDDAKVGILKDLAILVLTFYFTQKSTQAQNQPTEPPKTGV